MTFCRYKEIVAADLYRLAGKISVANFLKYYISGSPFVYVFWIRTAAFSKSRIGLWPLYLLSRLMLRRLKFKFGIDMPYLTKIGPGFCFTHFGGIVINGRSIVGRDCTISHGVTLGKANRGKRAGYPVVGDRVYIGPGAKVVGSVRIGNDVAIGANCVVVSDVPDNAVVVGVPGRVISMAGSSGYILNLDYQ